MKNNFSLLLILLFLTILAAGAQEKPDTTGKEAMKKLLSLYKDGKYTELLDTWEKIVPPDQTTLDLVRLKYDVLVKLKRLDDALTLLDEMIAKKGESEELVSARYNVFMKQKKFPEALKAALRKDEIARNKSPWDSLNIMHVYLEMASKEEAMDALQEAVNRGFYSYRMLKRKRYELLEKEKRFYEIIESIKVSIGLGNTARNFQVTLLNGEIFNLHRQKGKVVLVDFSATWCRPCHRDKKGLLQLYEMYKDKGFEIVSISLDTNEKRLKEYVEKFKLGWKHSVSGKVWEDPTVNQYGVNSLPSYWLIDKKSVLRSFGLKGKPLEQAIEALLKE